MATYLDSSDDDEYVIEIESEERPRTERFVNDEEGLKEKLQEFAWDRDLPFQRCQDITTDTPSAIDDIDDDLQRELTFYNQAVWAAKEGIKRFEHEAIPWQRPEDYYAEMVKSDGHMAKIKDQLMFEQKRIALSEQRRKARDAKKFAKQVQSTRKQEKQTIKKQKTKQIQSLRSQRKRMGFGEEFDWDMAIDEATVPAEKKAKSTRPTTVVKSGKRMYKDAKYGKSGGYGRARDRKRNRAESFDDEAPLPAKKRTPKRLGKRRRMAQVSKKNSLV